MKRVEQEYYLHLVWSTKYREDSIPEHEEAVIYRIMVAEACDLGCRIFAINGTSNHVHVLVRMTSTVTLSRLVNQMKGVSSHYLNDEARKAANAPRFRWQAGYGIFSIGRNQVSRVIGYIQNQKEHHKKQNLWPDWEHSPDTEDFPK
jgi:putative transposase